MTGFSADWLALREAADHRSRNRGLAERLAAHFAMRDTIAVVDLGAGTGSNLRATAPLLPARQTWTLIDNDTALLQQARETLIAWSDTASLEGGCLTLHKGGRTILVEFRTADLAASLDDALPATVDLVTASAFFDLASAQFMQRLAKAAAARHAVFYTVLTYDGRQTWAPRHPLDNEMRAAFHAHQITDKGLGMAAGPIAPSELADALSMAGYSVSECASDWQLDRQDAALIAKLATGFADAVRETAKLPASDTERWLGVARTGAEVGHIDTLAIPTLVAFDDEEDDVD
ncbi:MAG: hypothetical protein RLZ98_2084 [Pseudomonadota bacterium]|jgi:SAM-dependent methyltransferase